MAGPAIAIVGGGPCGLTLGRLLGCNGVDYVIYERDESESPNRAGGSLDIHSETGQRALKEAGLFDEFQKHARYDDTAFAIADKSGARLLRTGQGRDAPEIDRRALRQILLNAIPKEKIRWGHALEKVVLGEDGRPVLHFANGLVASGFNLVIGADGAWSKVRPLVCFACFSISELSCTPVLPLTTYQHRLRLQPRATRAGATLKPVSIVIIRRTRLSPIKLVRGPPSQSDSSRWS